MWVNEDKNKQGIMLDIGAGNPDENEYSPDKFVRQDVEPYKKIDLVCDIKDLDKFIKKDQCKVIRASHVMEHFSHTEIKDLFKMMYKLIEPMGIFHVVVPNLYEQAQKLLETDDQNKLMIEMYGGQKDEYDYHKMGFTPDILGRLLKDSGFHIQEMTEIKGIGWIDCKSIKIRKDK